MTSVGYKEIKNKGNYESETFWVETEIDSKEAEEVIKEATRRKDIVRKALHGVA